MRPNFHLLIDHFFKLIVFDALLNCPIVPPSQPLAPLLHQSSVEPGHTFRFPVETRQSVTNSSPTGIPGHRGLREGVNRDRLMVSKGWENRHPWKMISQLPSSSSNHLKEKASVTISHDPSDIHFQSLEIRKKTAPNGTDYDAVSDLLHN